MAVGTPLPGSYDYRLVTLSIFLSLLAAYAALDLAGRVTYAHGVRRLVWLCGGAVAMGAGIWSMHYVGMEAFHLSIPILYDWPTVLTSLMAAILASGVALVIVSQPTMGRWRTLFGSIVMGSGIVATHYIGMAAMRLQAMCVYSPRLVVLSVLLAIVVSWVALQLAFNARERIEPWDWGKLGSAILLGLAIPIMHYVGMAAATFVPAATIQDSDFYAVRSSSLGLTGITVVTLVLLALVYVSSALDRHMARQLQQFTETRLHLQAVFDNMSEGILVLDRDGRIVLVNKAALRLIGIPEGANVDQQAPEVFDVFLPTGEFLPAPQRPIGRALRGEFVQNFELNFLRKSDGETGLREVTTAPVLDANGQFGQVIVTFRDIAERQRMGEARTRLAAIVDSSQDAIIGKDTRGIVTTWNAGAEKIFGYSAREMIGQPIRLLLPPDHEQEEDDILARIENGDTVEHFETLRRKKDGDLIHVSLTISPIKDAHGRIVGASKIARNITETRKLERQLHQSQKMDAIGQLTGGIAHDFNNLLGIILGNLDLLESYAESNEAALDQVRTAQRAATRGADLTRRLLAFARMEGLKPASTLLNSSIESMIGLAKRVLGPEITITTQLDESLPRVFVDAAGLESALLNLVVNARDAMPGGGSIAVSTRLVNLEESYATVRMGELKAGWYACAAVSDTGEGMSKETLDRAFEPFFTTKSRDKGTGLGLAMVYGFAKQSGGAARIYSEPGKGTTVSIYLPLVAAEQEQSAVSQRQSPTTKMAGVVLVVDDEVDLLKIASAYLKEMGLTPLVAIDGASALEIIRREAAIDLMVTDIAMPGGMNGVELAQQTLVINPKIKLIYSSGFPADALAEKRMSLIQGPMLHKPYQRSEFKAMVRSVLEKSATTV